ncbi:protein rolling stone-like [Spodoptera litura]|uniref:Protein rolling stone-like n=1 Tax=Spodoptera litura TaxID=69820 RepID=A0A9J7E0A7_SPOLT|nr:protein rolling stone-like [Spodoptera litura]
MSAVKSYFVQEWKASMLTLEHPKPSDFYTSCWQTTRSSVPFLFWRAILFLTSLGIVLTSMIIYIQNGSFGYWFIYLTHWGLTSILFATGFATAVSVRCYLYGPISTEFKLPWYVKIYWTLFNIATPLAFLITIFYWTVLYEAGIEEELNHGLDVAVHGLNSLVMFLLLCSSAHPGRLLHIYQPLVFATIYMLFSVIYHAAGGTDQKGNAYIYPVVNWSEPGTTVLVVFITGLLLVVLHLLTLGLSALRDLVAARLIDRGAPANPNEGMPLRQPVYA